MNILKRIWNLIRPKSCNNCVYLINLEDKYKYCYLSKLYRPSYTRKEHCSEWRSKK